MIIYLHGFNSGFGLKGKKLEDSFPSQKVIGYNFQNRPIQDFENLKNLVKDVNEPIYIVGTSMGGFYGLLLYNYLRDENKEVEAFLINPSISPVERMTKRIGETFINYKTKEKLLVTKDMVNELVILMENEIDKSLKRINEINFYISFHDEVIDHEPLINLLYKSQKPYYIQYSKQNHRHQDISEVIKNLKEFINTNY